MDFSAALQPFSAPPPSNGGTGWFYGMAALPKTILALGQIVLAVSIRRHDLTGAMLFALMPVATALAARVPLWPILRTAAVALPFALMAGAAGACFESGESIIAFEVAIPNGWAALVTILLRTFATAATALLLAYTTPLTQLSGAIHSLGVPCVLIQQLQMMLRYLSILAAEAKGLHHGWLLRSGEDSRRPPLRVWGMLAGRLFLRTWERSKRISTAMQCRLYHAGAPLPAGEKGSALCWISVLFTLASLTCMRFFLCQ